MRFWLKNKDVARRSLTFCALLLCLSIMQPWPVSAGMITVTFDFDNSDHSWTNCGGPGPPTSCSGNEWEVGDPTTSLCNTTPSGSTLTYVTDRDNTVTEPSCSYIESPTIGFGDDALFKLNACWDLENATDAAQVRVSCVQAIGLDPPSSNFNNWTMIDPVSPNAAWYNQDISQNMASTCGIFTAPDDHGFTNQSPTVGLDSYEEGSGVQFSLTDSNPGGARFAFSNQYTKCKLRIYIGTHNSAYKGAKSTPTDGFSLDSSIVEMLGQTAVVLIYFEATGLDSEVLLDWETASEKDTIGFNVYRSLDEWGPFDEKINDNIIIAVGGPHHGTSYSITDTDVVNGVTYFYKLEEVDYQGNTYYWGPVSATPDSDSPVPLAPEDDSLLSALVPSTFEWNGLDFGMFKVQFSVDPDFPVENRISIPENGTWSPDAFLTPNTDQWEAIVGMSQNAGNAVLYWRVVGKDSFEDLAFSETMSFTLSSEESRAEDAEGGLGSLLKNLFLLITGRPL